MLVEVLNLETHDHKDTNELLEVREEEIENTKQQMQAVEELEEYILSFN